MPLKAYNQDMCKEVLKFTNGKTVIIGDFYFSEIDGNLLPVQKAVNSLETYA